MPLLTTAPDRYVLLVLDDCSGTLTVLLRRAFANDRPCAEIITCTSANEVGGRLHGGRRYSAVLTDAKNPAVTDRIIASAGQTRTPLLAVCSDRETTPANLRSMVTTSASPVRRADWPWDAEWPREDFGDRRGRLVAVSGPGGTGTSTVAAGLAAGLAIELAAGAVAANGLPPGRPAGWPAAAAGSELLLADFALHGDQSVLHGLPEQPAEVPSGLLGLIDTCRRRTLEVGELSQRTVAVAGYRLLTGLRRPHYWTAVSPTAFGILLEECARYFALVVTDVTGDFEGEADAGSIDVEERNHMARRVVEWADVVVVVGSIGALGKRRLALTVDELLDHGVDPARIQPVVNRSKGADAPIHVCGLPQTAVLLPDLGSAASLPRRAAPAPPTQPVPPPIRPVPPVAPLAPLVPAVVNLLSRLPPSLGQAAPIPIAPGTLGVARTVPA